MNKYQFKNKTQFGIVYYYCYGDDRFENWLNIKNIKYKKGTEGKNLFEEKDKEIERLNNIINELEKYMKEERINNGQIDEWTIIEIQMKLQELKGK